MAAWEWVEAYGALDANPEAVFGQWEDARKETERLIESVVGDEALEQYLAQSKTAVALKKGEVVISADGWGALEQLRRKADSQAVMEPHLDFGALQEEQADFAALLTQGAFPAKDIRSTPLSYCVSKVWADRLQTLPVRKGDWYTPYQQGIAAMARGDRCTARSCFETSIEMEGNGWAHYALAVLSCYEQDHIRCVRHALRAVDYCGGSVSVLREAGKLLLRSQAYQELLQMVEPYLSGQEIAGDGRIGFYRVKSLKELGRIDEAEQILYANGGLVVADLQEGENSITKLWFEIEEEKAKARGEAFDISKAVPPAVFDFRMNTSV
jgi:hypothetical protein